MRAFVLLAVLGVVACGSSSSSGSSTSSTSGSGSSGDGSGSTGSGSTGGSTGNSSGSSSGSSGSAACGCHGKSGCAVWENVYVSWYGFNDNSCSVESQHGCNDIAYGAPQSTDGEFGTPYPNAGNIHHTQATEGRGTYDDPITAAASADSDPEHPTASNPRRTFASAHGVTLTPGTLIYNPEVRKYFIFEDSCLECADEYACVVAPEDTDIGDVPDGCEPETNLHIDFWMGPSFSSDDGDLTDCEDDSTLGSDWVGGPQSVIINPPDDLPVSTAPLYTGSGTRGGCWTAAQADAASCP